MNRNILKNSGVVLFFGMVLVLLAGGFFLIRDRPLIADEYCHYLQISNILQGKDLFPKLCPYLPGYHWTMAGLVWTVRHGQIPAMRFLATFLSFLCILSFFFMARKIDRESAVQKSLLFLLFPLFYPFFSLIYTDLYAMMFVFLSLLLALHRRLWLAGIAGILGLLVRQNHIVWLILIACLVYMEDHDPQHGWKNIRWWFSRFFFFFLALLLCGVFVIWNKGLALGDKTHHFLTISCGNLFFLLFLFFFLFLPRNIANFPKIVRFLKSHKLMWLILAEVFLLYFFFFKADHFYNRLGRFLHNLILIAMTESSFQKCLFFIPIAYSLVSLCVTPLKRKSFYLLYPFTILFLLPNAVIEIRYLFVPLALFLAFKEADSERIAGFTLATYLVPIACIMFLLVQGTFFP